jgi:hypothetical protein
MQIKVKETKKHHLKYNPYLVDIAEGKLVLVECKPEEAMLYRLYSGKRILSYEFKNGLPKSPGSYVKPIIISKTEIEVDDSYLDSFGKIRIRQTDTVMISLDRKILALPEHFSPNQLLMIVRDTLIVTALVTVKMLLNMVIPMKKRCIQEKKLDP